MKEAPLSQQTLKHPVIIEIIELFTLILLSADSRPQSAPVKTQPLIV